jgi:hypothetical protein
VGRHRRVQGQEGRFKDRRRLDGAAIHRTPMDKIMDITAKFGGEPKLLPRGI